MADQTIIIHINGYWRDQSKTDLTQSAGIYFVYESRFNKGDQTVDLMKLLYIGSSDNIREGIREHPEYASWIDLLAPGNELCYATAGCDRIYRERVRSAYIVSHHPVANAPLPDPFLFDKTTIISNGRTALINPVITVKKSAAAYSGSTMFRHLKEMIPVRTLQVFHPGGMERRFAVGE